MSRDSASALVMATAAVSLAAIGIVHGCQQATAAASKPCGEHTAQTSPTKKQCLRALVRSKQAFPVDPTWAEAVARTTSRERSTLLAIARCEMGASRAPSRRVSKHHPPVKSRWATVRFGLAYGRYSTGFGVWNGNFPEIRRMTAPGYYVLPGDSPAEELLGVAALARKYGFSAWSCYRR